MQVTWWLQISAQEMIQFDERTSFSDGLVQLTRKRTEGKGLFGENFQDVQT